MGLRKHDWISKYLEYEENSEPPKLYKEWVAVSVIAAVLQRKCKLQWGNLTFYPNMYVVLVGPSGKCRKGTAMGTGKKFLRELGIKITAEAITREALIRDLASSGNTETQVGGKIQIHCSLTIYSPELAVFLGYENKQLMSDLTDWYDCADKWLYRTKGSGTDEIAGVWVNLLGATTPELIQTQFPEQAIGGGLSSRIIFVYQSEKSKKVALPFLNEEDEETFNWLVNELESIQMMSGEYKWTEGMIDRWVPWYNKYDTKDVSESLKTDRFAGYIERRPNHLLKLCMIISSSRRDDMVITGEVFDRAYDLLKRTERTMAKTFTGYGQAPKAGLMQKAINFMVQRQEATRQDLYKKFYYDIGSTQELDELIGSLKGIGLINIKVGEQQTKLVLRKDEDISDLH